MLAQDHCQSLTVGQLSALLAFEVALAVLQVVKQVDRDGHGANDTEEITHWISFFSHENAPDRLTQRRHSISGDRPSWAFSMTVWESAVTDEAMDGRQYHLGHPVLKHLGLRLVAAHDQLVETGLGDD